MQAFEPYDYVIVIIHIIKYINKYNRNGIENNLGHRFREEVGSCQIQNHLPWHWCPEINQYIVADIIVANENNHGINGKFTNVSMIILSI